MKKRELQVARPVFAHKDLLLNTIKDVLDSGRLMNGDNCRRFEEQFAQNVNLPYAISVNSCTTALEIVLKHIGIEGHEVIVPTNTFLSTANAVLFAGGTPILADIKTDTYFLDPAEILKRMTNKTKAVIAVHIAGCVPPEIVEIASICKEHGIPLVEDCAHAVGASFQGIPAGSFGYAGCFSFYPTKIITTGSGGMITTRNHDLSDYVRSMRLHGASNSLSDIVHLGNDWFMDEIKCAIGINQLESLAAFLEKRREIAFHYDQLMTTTDLIEKFPIHPQSEHAYYKYPVQIEAHIDINEMKSNFEQIYGFQLESIYWPTCHLQPVYRKLFGYCHGAYPVSESILSKQITLPIHAGLTLDDADYSFQCVLEAISKKL